jgi:hypothetical protein
LRRSEIAVHEAGARKAKNTCQICPIPIISEEVSPNHSPFMKMKSALVLTAAVSSVLFTAPKMEAQLGIPNVPFDLTYEQDPDGAGPITIGTPYRGGVQIFIEGLDAGVIYTNPVTGLPSIPVGTNTGAVSAATLNGLPQIPAPGGFGDDTWAIAFVTRIVDPVTNANVWTPLGKNQQITGMFYGAQDIWLRQNSLTNQEIASSGFTFEAYLQQGNTPVPSFAGILPSARTGIGQFPNFTNPPAPTNGASSLQLLARFQGTNGFFDPGLPDGIDTTATQFLGNFTSSVGAQGSGQGFATVDNTVGQRQFPGGPSIFESNFFKGIDSGVDLDKVTPGVQNSVLADARFVFSTQTLPNFNQPNRWTVAVTGPLETNVIPEPSSVLFGLSCLLPPLIRRRRSVAA